MTKEQRIIRKAVDELAAETPNIPYVRGLLDGLVEEPETRIINGVSVPVGTVVNVADGELDEAAILDAKARAAIASIKELGGDEV